MIISGNLFARIFPARSAEDFSDLLSRPDVRIERIVSTGQASPPGFWYDQPEGEWVVLLAGEAGLLLEGEDTPRALKPGDWIELPPHCRHRIEWTSCSQATIWLAVHYR
jgi:cupin 2 domain-containing protein